MNFPLARKMPKKTKSSSGSGLNGPCKFNFEKAWTWYNKEINKKAIICEKGIKIVEGWDNFIQQIVYDWDWEEFILVPLPTVGTVIHELYVNLVDCKTTKLVV